MAGERVFFFRCQGWNFFNVIAASITTTGGKCNTDARLSFRISAVDIRCLSSKARLLSRSFDSSDRRSNKKKMGRKRSARQLALSLHSISEGSLPLRTLPLSLNSNRQPPLPGCRSLKRREHGKARRDRGATGAFLSSSVRFFSLPRFCHSILFFLLAAHQNLVASPCVSRARFRAPCNQRCRTTAHTSTARIGGAAKGGRAAVFAGGRRTK